MEWRKTSLHCRRRRLHGRSAVRRRRGLDAGRRGRGARGRVSGRKVVMAQWVVAVERLLGASPKLLQLLTRALNLGRQEELQHGAQIGIPLRIIDILFFGATRSRPLSCPSARPVRSINMHYPLHSLFSACCLLHVHYTLTQSLTHSPAVVRAEAEEGPLPTEGTHFYSPPTPSWSSRPGLRR